MTNEQKLQAVIRAQEQGGCSKFQAPGRLSKFGYLVDAPHERGEHVLEILLDPEGLRAAYGETKIETGEGKRPFRYNARSKVKGGKNALMINEMIARRILDAWLSGGAEAAIQTAFDLLPPSQR